VCRQRLSGNIAAANGILMRKCDGSGGCLRGNLRLESRRLSVLPLLVLLRLRQLTLHIHQLILHVRQVALAVVELFRERSQRSHHTERQCASQPAEVTHR
jgi:hypothetical protein